MPITKRQCNQIVKYVLKFADRNNDLRIELEDTIIYPWRVFFNLGSTGGTEDGTYNEPTLTMLQELEVYANTGLPFKRIDFRTSDSGPGLAKITFKNKDLTLQFNEKIDERVIHFYKRLNKIINKSQQIHALSQDENEPKNIATEGPGRIAASMGHFSAKINTPTDVSEIQINPSQSEVNSKLI